MGVFSNSAIIILLLCIGEKGLVCGWTTIPNLNSFDDVFQVAKLALPDLIKDIPGMSSIYIHSFVNAAYEKKNRTEWQITVVVGGRDDRYRIKQELVTFKVSQPPASECEHKESICVKNPHIITTSYEDIVIPDGWQTVPNLQRFDNVYQVARISLPDLEFGLGMSSIQILSFETASRQKVFGTKWKISLVVTESPKLDVTERYIVNFETFQTPPNQCRPFIETICLRRFEIINAISPPKKGGLDVGWLTEKNLPLFEALYKVINESIPELEKDSSVSQVEVLHLYWASYEKVGRTSIWKIYMAYKATWGYGKFYQYGVTFTVSQPPPSECPPEKPVCVKDYKEINYQTGDGIPNFSRFAALYQAAKLVIPHLKGKWNETNVEIVHFVRAQYQPVAGNKWKIIIKVKAPSKNNVDVLFEVFQPLPYLCDPYGRPCVENIANVRELAPEP